MCLAEPVADLHCSVIDIGEGSQADSADDDTGRRSFFVICFFVVIIIITVMIEIIMIVIFIIIINELTYRKIKHRRIRRREVNPFHGIFDAIGVREGVAQPARDFGVICFFGEGCGVGFVEGPDEAFAEAQNGGFGRGFAGWREMRGRSRR